MRKIVRLVQKFGLVIGIPIVFIVVIFSKFFLAGLITIPTDILVGAYYPWLDVKYGYSVAVPVKNPLPSDVISIIYPWKALGISIIKSGHLPLWDNTILLGVPLLANFQSSILNPTNLLFFIFSNPVAWTIQTILQPILIFASMFLFLKKLKLTNSARIISSLLFAFSGFCLVWLEYNMLDYTLVYIPLIFLMTHNILEKPRLIYAFLLGICICLQIFSGYPLITLYTLLFIGVYFSYMYLFYFQDNFKFKLIIFLLGIITGFSLSAAQLLPGFEATNLSIRKFDNSALAGNIKYLPITSTLTFFVPDVYGNPATGNYWGDGSYDNFAFFIAGVGVFLFIISLVTRLIFNRENLPYFIFILIGLVLATHNPLTVLITKLDVLGMNSSVNARVLFIVCFATAILAGKTFDYILEKKLTLFEKIIPLVLYSVILISFIGGYFYLYVSSQQVDYLLSKPLSATNQNISVNTALQEISDGFSFAKLNFIVGIRNIIIPLIVILTATILIFLPFKKLYFPVIVILILLSTKVSFDKYLSFTDKQMFYPNINAMSDLQKITAGHRFIHEAGELIPQNTWSPYFIDSPAGQNNLAPLNTARYLYLVQKNELNDNLLTRYFEVTNFNSALLNTLDVNSIVMLNRSVESIPDKNGKPFSWILTPAMSEVANNGTVRIYDNKLNLGSAWFSRNVVCEDNLDRTTKFITTKNYNPAEVMVVKCTKSLNNVATGSAVQVLSEPNYVKFNVVTPENNYLHISKTEYPGWQAYIDGVQTEIKTSNIALIGVLVPKGEHEVELYYRPNSFYLGLKISIATLSLWLVFFFVKRLSRK